MADDYTTIEYSCLQYTCRRLTQLDEISPDQQLLVQLVTYYPERHSSVIIDPGAVLIPNKTIEVMFLPGIKAIDNLPLVGTEAPGGRVLKWRVKRR